MSAITAKREDYFKDRSYDPLAKYGRAAADRHVANDIKSTDSKSSDSKSQEQQLNLDSQIGFSNLPQQLRRRALRRGFEFNLMVIGESGLGKSTLLNTLFLSELYNADHLGPSKRARKTVAVEQQTVLLKENGVHLRLGLIDTPGFGDAVDNSNCWTPIADFIDARFQEQLAAEQKIHRGQLIDTRVHCALYFIAPSGHGLKALDVEFMKRIHDKVNIVPVIAKADCFTAEETREFKKSIMSELAQHKIKIYEFPDLPELMSAETDEQLSTARRWRERVPFAVIGANCLVDSKTSTGGKLRGRSYPWGSVEVENLEHNDFLALRSLLIRTHLHDLREVTHTQHYENYRSLKMTGIAQDSKFRTTDGKDPMAHMETERQNHEIKMRQMEGEMENVFDIKVKGKQQKLKESEAELQRRDEQMRKQLEQQEADLMERRRQFELEKRNWEATVGGGGGGQFEDDARGSSEPPVVEVSHSREKSKTEKRKGLFK